MRRPLTEDELDQLTVARGDLADQRQLAAELVALAEDPHPDDAVPVAQLLVLAGEHYQLEGDPVSALPLLRQAVAVGGPVELDPRCPLVDVLLELGSRVEADALAREVGRRRPVDLVALYRLGESYEMHGDSAAAVRWFTKGVLNGPSDDDAQGFALELLLIGRLRIRRAMGYPEDEYDEIAAELLGTRAPVDPNTY